MREKQNPHRPLEDWFELADYLYHKGGLKVQRFNYGPPFGERYLRDEVSCHLHLRINRPIRNLGRCNLCTEFYRSAGHLPEIYGLLPTGFREDVEREEVVKLDTPGEQQYWGQQSVFVRVGQIPENRQGIEKGLSEPLDVPSVVRLTPLNLCRMVPIYFAQPLALRKGFALESLNTITDRELDALGMPHVVIGIQDGELESEVIKRRPEIVHRVPDDRSDPIEERAEIRDLIDIQDVALGLRVELAAKTWAVGLDPHRLSDASIQAVSMFLGPLDLRPYAVQGDRHDG